MGSKLLRVENIGKYRKQGGAKLLLADHNLPLDATYEIVEYAAKRTGMGLDDTQPVLVRIRHKDIEEVE